MSVHRGDVTVDELRDMLADLPGHAIVRMSSGRSDRPDKAIVDARLVQRNGDGGLGGTTYVRLEGPNG